MRKVICRLAIAAVLAVAGQAHANGGWNVADTGQPGKEVSFRLTEGTWMSVAVSPDGRTILFDLLGDIYSMPATGGRATLVHGGPAIERLATFSPDGKYILYLSDRSGADNLWISRPDGSEARQVTREDTAMIAGPAWDPTGEYVAAVRVEATFPRMSSSEIRIYHRDGGAGRVVVEAPASGHDVQEPVFSPDGRYLYYTERVVDHHIYVDANHINYVVKRRDLATGQVDEILGGFGSATTPQVSPDGRRIAFVRRVKDKTVLFVHDLETLRQRPVYDALDRDVHADFVQQGTYYPKFGWFPDSRHIAVWGKGKLFRIDAEKAEAREIPFEVEARHHITDAVRVPFELAPEQLTVKAVMHLAVAPDERSFLFNALGRLWKKAGPDARPQRLTASENFEFEPAFSRDGRRIVYMEWNDERGSILKIADADGGRAKTLVASRGIIREAAFSPDGKRIVYRIQGAQKSMAPYAARAGIYVIDAAGGEPRRLVDDGITPQFSPDGRRIYYLRADYSDGGLVTRLESVNLDGFDRREHARAVGNDRPEVRVSPDLRWIAFKEYQQYYVTPYRETGAPLTLSADGGEAPVIRLTDAGGFNLVWAADSSAIYWTLGAAVHKAEVRSLRPDAAPVQKAFDFGLTVPGDRPEGAIAFVNGRIITMRDEEVIEGGTILVRGNRIEAVGPKDAVTLPGDAKVIDLAGKTVMPGLVDMHGHIDCCYEGGLLPQKQPPHYAALAFGITTNFDPYTSELTAYAATELQKAGVAVGPRIINSGRVIYGRADKPDSSYNPIREYADAQKIMERKRALGGVVIKSYKQPTRDRRQMLIKAGREAGIMVDVEGESHFYNNISMILDGHTSLEHNLPVANYYDDIVQLMARSGSSNTPTLIVTFGELFGENYLYQHTRAWDDPKVRLYVQETISGYSPLRTPYGAPPHVRGMTTIHVADELWDVGFRAVARATKKLDDAGVTVNVGSHGEVPGLAMHWEMQLLAEGGMSNHRILRAATINGARTLGLDRQIGSIEPGKLADIIVLDADPLADIRNSNSVSLVMVNGRLYDALTLDEIGNYDRPRSKFYWELADYNGIDWNEAWAGQ